MSVAGPSARSRSAADAVRGAREACGWTREQAAEALGVLPVEVAAWESGAIVPSQDQVERVRWCVDVARYDAAVAASPPCGWMTRRAARFEELRRMESRQRKWVARVIEIHRASCPVCGALPAPPPEPAGPGFRGWVARLPEWPRVLVKAGLAGAGAGAAVGLTYTLPAWLDASEPYDVLQGPLGAAGAVAWLVLAFRLLRPLGDRRPYLAGQLQSALMLLLPLAAFRWEQLASPGGFIIITPMTMLIGVAMGSLYEVDEALLRETDDAARDGVTPAPTDAPHGTPPG